MKFNFETENIYAFIPAGRLGNLKTKLDWNSIELNTNEIQKSINEMLKEKFNINLDFTAQLETYIRKLNTESSKEDRRRYFFNLSEEQLNGYKIKNIMANSFIDKEQLKSMVQDASQSIAENIAVKEKIKKLQQLKLLNS